MAKKSDVKKEEVAAVEAPKTDLVDVQMTKAELDEYAIYAAKKKDEKELLEDPVPSEPSKEYELTLLYEHNINGRKYGPGKAIVPEVHLGLVMHGENASKQQEVKMLMSNNRMFKIMDSGQAVPVAVNSVKI